MSAGQPAALATPALGQPGPREVVRAALAATRVVGADRLAWFDGVHATVPPALVPHLSPGELRRQLERALAAILYERCYTTGGPVPGWGRRPSGTSAPPRDWVAALAAAAPGGDCWEEDWVVRELGKDAATIDRQGLAVRSPRAEIRASSASPLQPGARVALRRPRVQPWLAPGFLLLRGERELAPGPPIVRLYWNVGPEQALTVLREVPPRLDRARLPYIVKVVGDPAGFDRRDSVVLCARRRAWDRLVLALAPVVAALEPRLRPGLPAFVRPLAAGLGMADDPSGGSFGASRCGLLAAGIVDAHETGATTDEDRLRVVEARFAVAGLDLDALHLEPGAHDLPVPSWAAAWAGVPVSAP